MNRIVLATLLSLFAVAGECRARPRLVVADFDTRRAAAPLDGAFVADDVVDALVASGLFELVRRSAADEPGFTGAAAPARLARVGRRFGARYVLAGEVLSLSSREVDFDGAGVRTRNTVLSISARVRIVDVERARVAYSTSVDVERLLDRAELERPVRARTRLAATAAERLAIAIEHSGKFDPPRIGAARGAAGGARE
ncbi:MAG TPA: hypothetical protein VGC30_05250 [Dokdonella sp.]